MDDNNIVGRIPDIDIADWLELTQPGDVSDHIVGIDDQGVVRPTDEQPTSLFANYL